MDEYGDVILQEDQYYWLFHANDSYSAVKLLQLDDDECTVADYETEEKSVVSVDSLVGMIPAPGEITLRTIYDDLTEAVDISEASILWNMKKKYDENKIYSSIGPILIALNPYCHIDALYSDSALQSYIDGYENQLPPHIWSIAKASFEQLKLKSHRQAIVISGESGAGYQHTLSDFKCPCMSDSIFALHVRCVCDIHQGKLRQLRSVCSTCQPSPWAASRAWTLPARQLLRLRIASWAPTPSSRASAMPRRVATTTRVASENGSRSTSAAAWANSL